MKIYGCVSKGGEETDGKEFSVNSLEEFIEILKENKEVHLNYFSGGEDLDLWVKVI